MDDLVDIRLTVNGKPRRGSCEPRKLLVDFIREDLGLTGTHAGCEHGICGACTIFINGEAARSCITLAVQADGAELMTVEGLADGEVSGWYHEGRPFGRWVADLLACPYWCLSVWSGLVVAVLVRCGPVGRVIVRALALSLVTAVGYDEAVPNRKASR